MDLGLVIALLALRIGVIAILKVPRQAFLRQPSTAEGSRLEAPEREVAEVRRESARPQRL